MGVLSGQEGASLEWISVKHAMAIEFSEESPIAALAGGKGSVQTSMDGAGGHVLIISPHESLSRRALLWSKPMRSTAGARRARRRSPSRLVLSGNNCKNILVPIRQLESSAAPASSTSPS